MAWSSTRGIFGNNLGASHIRHKARNGHFSKATSLSHPLGVLIEELISLGRVVDPTSVISLLRSEGVAGNIKSTNNDPEGVRYLKPSALGTKSLVEGS